VSVMNWEVMRWNAKRETKRFGKFGDFSGTERNKARKIYEMWLHFVNLLNTVAEVGNYEGKGGSL
jgi:hypothetical protein